MPPTRNNCTIAREPAPNSHVRQSLHVAVAYERSYRAVTADADANCPTRQFPHNSSVAQMATCLPIQLGLCLGSLSASCGASLPSDAASFRTVEVRTQGKALLCSPLWYIVPFVFHRYDRGGLCFAHQVVGGGCERIL